MEGDADKKPREDGGRGGREKPQAPGPQEPQGWSPYRRWKRTQARSPVKMEAEVGGMITRVRIFWTGAAGRED